MELCGEQAVPSKQSARPMISQNHLFLYRIDQTNGFFVCFSAGF